MTRISRQARLLVLALVPLVLASCEQAVSFPDRAPDARGTLASYEDDLSTAYPPDTSIFHLTVEEDAYSYYQDAALYFDEDTIVGDQFGNAYGVDFLYTGTWVEIWTDACAESHPVQCDVTHVRLTAIDDVGM